MSCQFEYIALRHSTGHVSRMQFMTHADAGCFDVHAAATAGFIFNPDTNEWVRQATQANIEREIARSSFPKIDKMNANADIGPVIAWRIVKETDFPAVRKNFDL